MSNTASPTTSANSRNASATVFRPSRRTKLMDLLTTAKALAERVAAEATKAKVPVAVCITDIHGNLVLQHRMNGAPLFSLEISDRKAYTAALVGVRTADLLALVQP